ncbi:exodeoxyribonuclease V subunit alpha [Candidatus Methylocalor cossyra]|uniref:RecBCD enzyme subunit RecD n=1 Tax=Candidatus Methylocalor cossyra TaxID=3108543 RepID=A0ABM9NLQ8_9GAMM
MTGLDPWTESAASPDAEDSPLARQFAAYLCRLNGESDPAVIWATRLVCQAVAEGHVCLPLQDYAGRQLGDGTVTLPPLAEWVERLRRSDLVGQPGEFAPLILDRGPRLYLARYWNYEHNLAERLLAFAATPCEGVNRGRLRADLERLFPAQREIPDQQKLAAAVAVLRRFCIITGGPGTGKTSTVVRILAALQAQAGDRPLSIALAAPTGKAAARLQEAVRSARLDLPESMRQGIPECASTLHRLLGARPDSIRFHHGRDHPLPVEVVVVDEASMVDLALLGKLVDALPDKARLILLGDKDQLAAVEAGAVFADLCAHSGYSAEFAALLSEVSGVRCASAGLFVPALADCVVFLRHSHRFRPDSGIFALAGLVNQGRVRPALELLARGAHPDLVWVRSRETDRLAERMAEGYRAFLEAVQAGGDPRAILKLFDRFRVLTAHRDGERGARGVNRLFEEWLRQHRRIPPGSRWYAGRPVMVTRNDYALRLFNGDIGVALGHGAELKVYFEDAEGTLRGVAPARLPEHDTVYAMTVHKSQGSEFDEIVLLLPETESPVLDRPLLYTALTRARRRVEIRASQAILEAAIRRQPRRASGLAERLVGG